MSLETKLQKVRQQGGIPLQIRRAPTIPVLALGMSLGLFFAISYLLCVLLYFWFPAMASNHAVLVLFLPGFKLLTWPSFFLGLIESFGYGWYVALVFAPIYNFFAIRWG
jgi:hypothetical protein